MATIFDTVDLVKKFSENLGTAPAAEQAPSKAYEVGKKAGQAVSRGGGWLSRLLGKVPGLALATEGVSDFGEPGKETASAIRTGVGIASTFSPPARAVASGMLGGELAAQGVASFADAMNPQKPVLAPGFADEVRRAGGEQKYSEGVQERVQAQADAAAAKFTADRTARVNQVIADSQAARKQDAVDEAANDRLERRTMIEQATARTKAPDAKLFSGGFDTLSQLLAQTAQYVSKRGQLNRLAKQEFAADEKALDRESAEKINTAKLLTEFQKAMKPDYKIAMVKTLTGETPVITADGTPKLSITTDDKGNITYQPVRSRPTTAQAHAQAKARIDASSNKAQTKALQNQQLKELGYPPLP